MWDGWHSRNAIFWDWDHLLPSVSRLDYGELSVGGANTIGPSFGAAATRAAAATTAVFSVGGNNNNAANDNRLPFDSALNNPATIPRPSSLLSNASSVGCSLRPISTTCTNSHFSRASSGASSVRWDEEGLETIREEGGQGARCRLPVSLLNICKEKDRVDKRISREGVNIHWKARNVTRLLLFFLTCCGDRMLRRRVVVGEVVMRGLVPVVDVWVGTRM